MLSKNYFKTLKGKKVTFKVVNHFGDIKVKFDDTFADYKVKIVNSDSFSDEIIKVEIVEHFPDVILRKVSWNEDFEVYID